MGRYFVGIRPTKPNRESDSSHITLDYLGNLSEEELIKVKKTLGDIAARNTEFNLQLHNKGLNTFGGRTVSELKLPTRMNTLQKDIYKNIDMGASTHNKPENYRPHISLKSAPTTTPIEKINKIYLYSDSKPLMGFRLKDKNIFQKGYDYIFGD